VSLTFLLGGARSGKSSLAVQLAREWEGPVSVIVTAEARDEEMAQRIRLHREARPVEWQTIEEPVELGAALQSVPADSAAVVDCVSLWVANMMEHAVGEDDIEALARTAAELAAERSAATVVVSNEVGLGVVPPSELGRRYRDVLGRVNALWAAAADEAAFVIAGRMLPLR
jgi:adenosylcobinamide kinase / adenosylcobinamide-phosphate guanylyltransferase